MNFEEIKREMDEAVDQEQNKKTVIDLKRGKNNPVNMIRSNMKKEIIMQLASIVVFMLYPVFREVKEFNESIYYIFMFITSMMTMGYIIKLSFFLRKTSNFTSNTKDAIKDFIFEAKLTLEVYKSFIIAGSLLLPFPVFALLSNRGLISNFDFERWFLLKISPIELTFLVIGYLIMAVVFYFTTVGWTKLLYGKYLKELENIIVDLKVE